MGAEPEGSEAVSRRAGAVARDPRSEKQVEADIIEALQTLGFSVVKLSQAQRPVGMTEGTPDIYARHLAWQLRVWVEVKRPRGGRVSLAQLAWHAAERAAGGAVVVARTVGELVKELKALGAPIT